MRAGFAIVAGSLVLAVGFAVSLPAQAPDSAMIQKAPDAAGAAGKAATPTAVMQLNTPAKPGDGLQSRPTGTSALTADECTNMDGEIVSNQYSGALCASKKMCVRTDNKGKTHAMCLEQ